MVARSGEQQQLVLQLPDQDLALLPHKVPRTCCSPKSSNDEVLVVARSGEQQQLVLKHISQLFGLLQGTALM